MAVLRMVAAFSDGVIGKLPYFVFIHIDRSFLWFYVSALCKHIFHHLRDIKTAAEVF